MNFVPLAELAKVNPSRHLPKGVNAQSEVSFIPMGDVDENGYWFQRQTKKLLEVSSGFTPFLDNDVLVAKITPCMENGKGAIVTDMKNGAGFGSTEFHVLRALPGVSPRFLYHITQSSQFRKKAEAFMIGSAGQQRVQKDFFEHYLVPDIPSLEQDLVADILDDNDTSIRQTEAIIAKLQQVKQGLLHDLLTRGIDDSGQLRPPQHLAPELYKKTPVGWIPKDWYLVELQNIADVSRGKFTHRPRNDPRFFGGEYPFIQTGDIAFANGEKLYSYSQTLSNKGIEVSKEFPIGTIAVTIAANIADTAILGVPMFFPDSVVGVVANQGINNRFIELTIRRAKPQLDARAPQSAQKNINLQDLKPLPVALPNQIEQERISDVYETTILKLKKEEQAVEKLKIQKSGLMNDLLTGKVRVISLL